MCARPGSIRCRGMCHTAGAKAGDIYLPCCRGPTPGRNSTMRYICVCVYLHVAGVYTLPGYVPYGRGRAPVRMWYIYIYKYIYMACCRGHPPMINATIGRGPSPGHMRTYGRGRTPVGMCTCIYKCVCGRGTTPACKWFYIYI